MSVTLSIIIPAFNVEDYVTESIESVLAQSFKDLEVIVIDDGSTDQTREVLNQFSDNPRVKVIAQQNRGPSGSRNSGIRIAQGKYIGFLDADDRWAANKAQRHFEEMESHPEIDLTFSWWRIIDEKGRDTGRRGQPSKLMLKLEDLILENSTGTGSTLFARKEAIDAIHGFDDNLRAAVDLDLLLRIAQLRDDNILCIPEILTDYRMREGQITQDWNRMARNWEKVIAKVREKAPERLASVETLARFRQFRYYAYIAYQTGDITAARHCLRKALFLQPGRLLYERRNWMTTLAILSTYLPESCYRWLEQRVKKIRARRFDR
jgi:glycosyltransferase involved in cell wall biosynthesis